MSLKLRQNELIRDDDWQRSVFDRLLASVLMEQSYRSQIIFLDIASQVASLLQRQAHIDIVAQLPAGKTMSLEVKIVRWPGVIQGRPSRFHWRDLFLETWSCTVPGHEQRGWLVTSQADILLWCQCALDEDSLDCWPFPFKRLRKWYGLNFRGLEQRRVENIIDGRALWTQGRLAPINKICRDLKVEGFRVDRYGLISDLLGKPLLRFLHGAPA